MSRILLVLIAALALAGTVLWFYGSPVIPRDSRVREPGATAERVEHGAPASLELLEPAEDDTSSDDEEPIGQRAMVVAETSETPSVEPELHTDMTLAGVVRDESGAPLADVELSVEARGPASWRSVNNTAESAADGTFHIVAPEEGKVRILASLEGYVTLVRALGELQQVAAIQDLVLVLGRGQSIAGVVRRPDGSPAEAKLELVPRRTSSRRHQSRDGITGESDASGAFAISGLSEETYRITARARDGHGIAEVEQVTAGTRALVLTLSDGLALAGRVVDERGAGVADFILEGRRIEATGRRSRDGDLLESFRDTDGSFAVDGLVPGTWDLWVASRGHAESALRVSLPASAPVELILPREAVVSGRVLDPRGAPVAEASVQAAPEENLSALADGHSTDEQGLFEIRRLSPGPVALLASGSSFAPSEVLSLELTAGETIPGIVLRLRTGGTILGELVGSDGHPQAGRAISLHAQGFYSRSETDVDGRFQVASVPPGEIDVLAETLVGAQLKERVTVGDGVTVQVHLAAPSGLVRLRGRVRAGGEAFAGGKLMASLVSRTGRTSGGYSHAEIDEDGAYEITLTGPGRHEVKISRGEPFLSWDATVDVPAVEAFEFDVSIPLGRISGRVTDSAGRAVSGIAVHADPEQREGEAYGTAEAQTDAEGRYELQVPAGRHAVVAGGWRQEFREESPPYAEACVRGLVVTENVQLHDVDLRLEEGGILEGVVRNPDGSPAGRALLLCEDENAMLGATDENGSFRILGVTVGKHILSARGRAGGTREPVLVEIVAGEARRIELELGGK